MIPDTRILREYQHYGGSNLLFDIIFAEKLHENEKSLDREGTRFPRTP